MWNSRRTARHLPAAAALAMLIAATATPKEAAAQTAAAGTDTSGIAAVAHGVALQGFVSSAYTWNFNKTEMNRYRAFDTRHDSFTLDVAQLSLARTAAAPREAGFRIDIVTGYAMAPVLTYLAGQGDHDVALEQAYLRYVAPVGSGLTVDAGKFTTHLTWELAEGVDGWNGHYSHSFLFTWAVPFTHTGVRLTYPVTPSLTAMVHVTNGWDDQFDIPNQGKCVGGQVIAVPVPALTLYGNFLHEPEGGPGENHAWAVEGIASVALAPRLRVTVDALAGGEDGVPRLTEKADSSGTIDARWSGGAAYVSYDLPAGVSLNLRGEIFDDRDGFRTGLAQKLTEFTFTPEYRITESMSVRCDFRIDRSDQKAFFRVKTGGAREPVRTQPTIGLNWVARF